MNKLLATVLVGAIIAFFYFDGDKKFTSIVGGGSDAEQVTEISAAKTPAKKKKSKVIEPIDMDAPRRMIIGLDLSASNPLVEDVAYAQKVGRRLHKEIETLEYRSELKLRTFGAYGASNNPISMDVTISTRTKARADVNAREINTFVSNIPNLVNRGQLDTQNYTNILAFMEELSVELDCKELPTQVILVTDGIEDSEYVRLIHQNAKLPKPGKIFRNCYELQILGVGRSMRSPSETNRIREEWRKWAKYAGFKKYTAVNDW